jgi:hypothetical protein
LYYIYNIAYKISDEMAAQKEAEKPFWWEHLHSSVKDLSIEDVEKHILEAGTTTPEKLAEMTKHEKYLAVSEGCYVLDSEKAGQVSAELDSLKKEVERSKTSFLNQPTTGQVQPQPMQQETFEPIEFGKPVSAPSAIPSGESTFMDTPPAVKADEGIFGNTPNLPPLGNPAPVTPFGSPPDIGGKNDPFGGPIKNDFASSMPGTPGTGKNSAQIRQYAQSIVSDVVSKVNAKADSIPDDVAMMKEHELLQAVIKELQTLK